MDELVEHLKPENMQRLIDLYPHPFGEVKRLRYRILRSAVRNGADRLILRQNFFETSSNGEIMTSLELTVPVENVHERWRSRLLQILERDQVVARYVRVVRQTPNELGLKISNDEAETENMSR
jgi:hypothetical protein